MDKSQPKLMTTDKEKDDYVQFIRNVMVDVSESPNERKIIKNIVKETVINKRDVQ